MSTLSVPLTASLETFIHQMVRRGYASSKSEVVRRALTQLAEDEAVMSVLRAEQEVKEGKAITGDLRKILKAMS